MMEGGENDSCAANAQRCAGRPGASASKAELVICDIAAAQSAEDAQNDLQAAFERFRCAMGLVSTVTVPVPRASVALSDDVNSCVAAHSCIRPPASRLKKARELRLSRQRLAAVSASR